MAVQDDEKLLFNLRRILGRGIFTLMNSPSLLHAAVTIPRSVLVASARTYARADSAVARFRP